MGAQGAAGAIFVAVVGECIRLVFRGSVGIEVYRRSILPAAHHLGCQILLHPADIAGYLVGQAAGHFHHALGLLLQVLPEAHYLLPQLPHDQEGAVVNEQGRFGHGSDLSALAAVTEQELADRHLAEVALDVEVADIDAGGRLAGILDIGIAEPVVEAEMLLRAGHGLVADHELPGILGGLQLVEHACGQILEILASGIQYVWLAAVAHEEQVDVVAAPRLVPFLRVGLADVAQVACPGPHALLELAREARERLAVELQCSQTGHADGDVGGAISLVLAPVRRGDEALVEKRRQEVPAELGTLVTGLELEIKKARLPEGAIAKQDVALNIFEIQHTNTSSHASRLRRRAIAQVLPKGLEPLLEAGTRLTLIVLDELCESPLGHETP